MLEALEFAADRHRLQRRKDSDASPYVNHVIAVASCIARIGLISDPATLVAAVLHDTLEDTESTPDELEDRFGREIRQIVEELTDDKSLPKDERKRLQIEHAAGASKKAKVVKLGDKICNVLDVTHRPPPDWTIERRRAYLEWSQQVVDGCRAANEKLERYFDSAVTDGYQVLYQEAGVTFRNTPGLRHRVRSGTMLETYDYAYLQVLDVDADGVFARDGVSPRSHWSWESLAHYGVRIHSQPPLDGVHAASMMPRVSRRGGPLERLSSTHFESRNPQNLELAIAVLLRDTETDPTGRWSVVAVPEGSEDGLRVEPATDPSSRSFAPSGTLREMIVRHREVIEETQGAAWTRLTVTVEPVEAATNYGVKFHYD